MTRAAQCLLVVFLLSSVCEGRAGSLPTTDNFLVTIDHIPSPNFGRIGPILRDRRGFLWFGTTNGLYRYDGYEIRVYENVATPDTVVSFQNRVTAILNNPDGSLLLGTWNGLWRFDPLRERFEPFLDNIRFGDGKIERLSRDSSGTLWIGTRLGGLFGFGGTSGGLRHYSVHNGLSDSSVQSLIVDHSGAIWVGTRREGLNRLDPSTSTITHYRHDPSDPSTVSDGFILTVLEDDAHSIWVGTYKGLNKLDPSTGRVQQIHIMDEPKAAASALVQDPDGRLWVGFDEGGIYCLSDSSQWHFSGQGTEQPLLSDEVIDNIYIDPTSTRGRTIVWVGTRGGGVNKIVIRRNPFRVALRDLGSFQIGRGAVLSLCEDHRGILWAGMWGGGLHAFRQTGGGYQRIARYEESPARRSGWPSNDVYCMVEDREGNLWVGTNKGLCVFDAGRRRFVRYRHIPGDSTSIAGDVITALMEDSQGIVWIGTGRGISRLMPGNPGRFKSYLHTGVDGVTDVVEDRSSRLWVTMSGRGLHKFDREGDRFIRLAHPGDASGVSENWISTAFPDRRGSLWMWTSGGLVTFDPRSGNFSEYGSDFLHRAFVFDIAEDNSGHLWFSTGIGLLRLTPGTGTVVRYDYTYGFPFSELTSGFFRTPRGSWYVGGLNGFGEFTPDSLIESSVAPAIAITEFAVFGKPQPPPSHEIHLAHNQNFFSFSFAALDFTDPARNRFAWRMEGVDAEWIDAGARHYASYTNLDPGTYVFRVRGSNSEGVWNEEGAMVQISIEPPFWRTWWFALLTTSIVAAGVTSLYRYRVRKLLEMQRIRLRIANDLHDDVGSNLGAIAFVSRTLQDAPELTEATRRRLTTIYNTAVKTSEGMRDIVWFISPARDNIDDLILHMKDTASSMLGPIGHRFEDRTNGVDVHLSLEFRRNVFLAFKEILTNIVRHSGATLVEIEVVPRQGILEVSVRDNGKGFDEGTTRAGNGLASIRNRAGNTGGDCTIASSVGGGTTVRFTAPLREKQRKR